jgi:hypothetical protein
MPLTDHPHPSDFHLSRWLDRGWGELACEYRWRADSGDVSELDHCRIYELIRYEQPVDESGGFLAPNPPFIDWWFRNPTDGRTAPVGLECFPASQGWAWDRHKMLGRLQIPGECEEFEIRGVQEYRFVCDLCGLDERIHGSHSGPHDIVRRFAPTDAFWRYSITKHNLTAWMDINTSGYVADSADIGFGPW